MKQNTRVLVFAPPIAACGGGENPWKIAAEAIFERIRRHYPDVVCNFIEYFSPGFFEHTTVINGIKSGELTAPVILVDNEVLPAKGKISEKEIREYIRKNREHTNAEETAAAKQEEDN